MGISAIDDCIVSEVLKNDDMEIRKDDVFEKEEKEDIIDMNQRVHEQETDDAEKSVMDDCKNLEVGKNDIMEIKTDDEIEKEDKEDDKETRTVNVIENDEQEDVIDLNEIEVEQQTYDAEISVIDDCKNLEVGKNENIEIKTDDENEKEEKEYK